MMIVYNGLATSAGLDLSKFFSVGYSFILSLPSSHSHIQTHTHIGTPHMHTNTPSRERMKQICVQISLSPHLIGKHRLSLPFFFIHMSIIWINVMTCV